MFSVAVFSCLDCVYARERLLCFEIYLICTFCFFFLPSLCVVAVVVVVLVMLVTFYLSYLTLQITLNMSKTTTTVMVPWASGGFFYILVLLLSIFLGPFLGWLSLFAIHLPNHHLFFFLSMAFCSPCLVFSCLVRLIRLYSWSPCFFIFCSHILFVVFHPFVLSVCHVLMSVHPQCQLYIS